MFTSRIHRSIGPATIRSFPRRRLLVAAAASAAALFALTGGVAQAASTTQSFPFSIQTSILAPSNASYGQIMVSTTCNLVTHYGAVSLGVQLPILLTNGTTIETQVWVKNHSASSYNGQLYLAHSLTRVYPTLGFTDLIGTKLFVGAARNSYDVAVWYRYQQPNGQWTGWYSFQESLYSTVINTYNNVLETGTCQT